MKNMIAGSVDAAKEKHVPVIEKTDGAYNIVIGSVAHPMEEKHYIEWVEVRHGNNVYIHGFRPGEKPEAEFCVPDTNVRVREYCSVHGLWTNKA